MSKGNDGKVAMLKLLGELRKDVITTPKSVLVINEDLVDDREDENQLIKLDDKLSILAVKAEGDCFYGKIIKSSMGEALKKMKWVGGHKSYKGKFLTSNNVTLSWVVNCLNKEIPFVEDKPENVNVHHVIFRFLEIPENLREMPQFMHRKLHKALGSYARNQSIIISDKSDLEKLRLIINGIMDQLGETKFDWSKED